MNDEELKALAYEMVENLELFSVDHPYVDHIQFLNYLEKAYAEKEEFEVSKLVLERINILTKKQSAVESIIDLVNKIQILSEMQKKRGQ